MAYQSFYRTYRPTSFAEIVGQEPIVRTLKNALLNGKIGHAYLFCGPRGTGKTTMARLFAKALNCEEGPGHECNHCANCQAILNDTHPDVYEIDAASNSGVDNVRDLIEQVRYEPILGRYKVYIIDEIHSMTTNAFNALLKTLEEPPENVVFILATTEPQKVLPTILSRVQRFDFSKISTDGLIQKMKSVLECEKVEYDSSSLALIARLADGGARDALSILEQVASYSGGRISAKDVQTLFGLISIEEKIALVKDLHDRKTKEVLAALRQMYSGGIDIVRLHDDLIGIYKDLLIYGTTRDDSLLTQLQPDEALHLAIGPKELRSNLLILTEERRNYRAVNSSFDHFELCLLKLMTNDLKPEPASKSEVLTAEPQKRTAPDTELRPASALPEPKPAEIVKDRSPAPATTITYDLDSDERIAHLSEEELINIMVQGDKRLKENLLAGWNNLGNFVSDPNLGFVASFLRSTTPRIVNSAVLVVEAPLLTQVTRLNAVKYRELLKKLIAAAFGLPLVVYALSPEEYIKAVELFRQLNQVQKLPAPKPIVIK